MDPVFEAESLVAVLGVKHVLGKKIKTVTVAELHRAGKLAASIPKRLEETLGLKTAKKYTTPTEMPDYRETEAALSKGIDGDAKLNKALWTLGQKMAEIKGQSAGK